MRTWYDQRQRSVTSIKNCQRDWTSRYPVTHMGPSGYPIGGPRDCSFSVPNYCISTLRNVNKKVASSKRPELLLLLLLKNRIWGQKTLKKLKIFVKKSNFSVEKFGKCELCQNRFFQNVPPRGGVVDDCRIEKRSSPTGHVTRQKIYSYRILVKSKNGVGIYRRKNLSWIQWWTPFFDSTLIKTFPPRGYILKKSILT